MRRLFKTHAGLTAFLASRRPDAYHVLVMHDKWCSPSRCTCRPWFEVRDLTPETLLEGVALEEKRAKESSS